jgi:hypothetical protein
MEFIEEFVSRLTKDVGCYNHKTKYRYSLKKYETGSIFGWVGEKKGEDIFFIASLKKLADKANVTKLANEIRPNNIFGKPGVGFLVQRDSQGEDYDNAVKALRAIKDIK